MSDKITIYAGNGMVDIQSELLVYGNVKSMYQGDRNGHGIQVAEGVDEKKALEICDKISGLVYELQDDL